MSITDGASIPGVSRQPLTKIVNGKSGISAEMAIRLTKVFGSTAELWVGMQASYELALGRRGESKIKVQRQHVPQGVVRPVIVCH